MRARQCRLAIKQSFTQDGEKETALHTGRGTLSVKEEIVLLCYEEGGNAEMSQTVSFPLSDPTAVTAATENGTTLRFPVRGTERSSALGVPSSIPITVNTPMGPLAFDFFPLSVENSIDPEKGKGSLLLRYRLTWGNDALREAELRYTLLGFSDNPPIL